MISDAYESLRTHIIQTPVAVTSALLAGWEQVKTLVINLLKRVDKLLQGVLGISSPVDGVVSIARQIYLAIGWILARLVRGTIKMCDSLSGLLLQIGARLQALT